MSAEYKGQDPLDIAAKAESDLNSTAAKTGGEFGSGKQGSDSTLESGVNESVEQKFPGSEVTYGSAASGAGDNREIPLSEGGEINKATGQPTKARDYEGAGGPDDKARQYAENSGGNEDILDNVRQGGNKRASGA